MVMISKRDALKLIKDSSKYFHAIVVSAILWNLAKKLQEDEDKWEIVGLFHDIDCDMMKEDSRKHGIIANELLKEHISEECLHAVKSHDYRSDLEPISRLDRALIIADSLAIILERMEENLGGSGFEEETERIFLKEPWLKENVSKCKEIGLDEPELYALAKKFFKLAVGSRYFILATTRG
jgi:HD superfamily phosphodiesterase